MKPRTPLLLLPLLFIAGGAGRDHSPGAVVQRVVHSAGFVEPHTPGSAAPEEMAATPGIEALLGGPLDLNRVTSVRTRWEGRSQRRPKAVLILIPGFLGGATTLDPIARDLVARFQENGLTPEPKSFASYLESIATLAAWQEVHIVPGYAHLDVVSAEDNEAVPLIADFIRRVRGIPPGQRR
jgi:hypothetical protein